MALLRLCCVASILSTASTGSADAAERKSSRELIYGPVPAWVTAPPAPSAGRTPDGALFRAVYADQQVHVTRDTQEEYQASRIKLLSADALAIGNITLEWSPASEEVTIHRLAIVRDGKSIDVLKTQKFSVIQREDNLEKSMLDGKLTATIQIAGLQIGDEVEFASSRTEHMTRSGEKPQGLMQFPIVGAQGAYRLRIVAPKDASVSHRSRAGVPDPTKRTLGGETELQYDLTDPASMTLPEGAPARYSVVRTVQWTGYDAWDAVSRSFDGPFTRAELLSSGSPIRAQAALIAAKFPDPEHRAEAALKLVQDQVRYVYVGLDGGNYLPAAAELTWERRFGDCKAKTVLLIALLRELGIDSEPVLVASNGADGLDEYLPTPIWFDHVLVRATIDGAPAWLDGTRQGDSSIDGLSGPPSRWVLPVRKGGAVLEKVAAVRPKFPLRIEAVEIDASAGFSKPGKYRLQNTFRGDEVMTLRSQLAALPPADASKLLAAYWRQKMSDVEPTNTSWRFDEANRSLTLSMEGTGKVDWDGDDKEGHTHYLFGAGFPPPDEMKRPKDQPQGIPWANDYPAFTCYATTVKLPPSGKGLHWQFSSRPMDVSIGGIDYWRISSFDGTTARMVKSRRVSAPEITAAQATSANALIPYFDNKKSYVWEVAGKDSDRFLIKSDQKFGSFDDFASGSPPCQPPGGKPLIRLEKVATGG